MMLDNLQRQAALSRAPLLLGEWGSPNKVDTDANRREQRRFTEVYQFTANQMDHRGIGGIKPRFCGTRRMVHLPGAKQPVTWVMFFGFLPREARRAQIPHRRAGPAASVGGRRARGGFWQRLFNADIHDETANPSCVGRLGNLCPRRTALSRRVSSGVRTQSDAGTSRRGRIASLGARQRRRRPGAGPVHLLG